MSEVMEADVPFPNNKIMIDELITYTYPNTSLSPPAEKSHTCFIFVPPREGKGDKSIVSHTNHLACIVLVLEIKRQAWHTRRPSHPVLV
jgi:hypothetical protein